MTTLESALGQKTLERQRFDGGAIELYLARGRQLHAEAVAGYAARLLRGLAALPRIIAALVGDLPRNRLWRVPGSGNCVNC